MFISLCFVCGVDASVVPIAIENPSFEDISGQSTVNEFTLVVPNGWTAYNPGNLISGAGLFFGTLDTDGAFFDPAPNPAPDGDRVAILYNQNQKGGGEYGIEQVLGDTLQPLMQYTLQVEVGNIGSGTSDSGDFFDLENFPGYRIDLFAGTNLVMSDDDLLSIPERTFSNAVLQAIVGPDHPGLGELLMIRLVNLNSPIEPDDNVEPYDAHEVDFDHVWLDAEFVAEQFSTSNGSPYSVLIAAGLATTIASVADFESASQINSDGDVHLDWQEYITGSDPGDSLSFFSTTITYTNIPAIHWGFASNRSYTVFASTNLAESFYPLAVGLQTNHFSGVDGTNAATYYQVEATLE